MDDAIGELLDGHLGGRSDHGNRLWLLLNAELWHRIRIEGAPVADLEVEIASLLSVSSARAPRAAPAGSVASNLAR